jgi:hypothetical protein
MTAQRAEIKGLQLQWNGKETQSLSQQQYIQLKPNTVLKIKGRKKLTESQPMVLYLPCRFSVEGDHLSTPSFL